MTTSPSNPFLNLPGAVEGQGEEAGVAAFYRNTYLEQRELSEGKALVDLSHLSIAGISPSPGHWALGWFCEPRAGNSPCPGHIRLTHTREIPEEVRAGRFSLAGTQAWNALRTAAGIPRNPQETRGKTLALLYLEGPDAAELPPLGSAVKNSQGAEIGEIVNAGRHFEEGPIAVVAYATQMNSEEWWREIVYVEEFSASQRPLPCY